MARLMTPDLAALVGEWFEEIATAAPDVIGCDDGCNLYD